VNGKTISVIALSSRDYADLPAKLREAVHWMECACLQGADLVVFPETLNVYKGDGPGNPNALSYEEAALDDWEAGTRFLREAAVRLKVAVVLPLLIREDAGLANVFFLISKEGRILGRYQKMRPTEGELAAGVVPGAACLMDWEGIPVAGAICFDTNFLETFDLHARMGARLFLIPSLWNGGPWLDGIAARFTVPMAVAYPAWSKIVDLDGSVLASGGYRQETLRFGYGAPVYTASLNFNREVFHLNEQADRMTEIRLRYQNAVRVKLLHEQGAFSVESLSFDLPISKIIQEYGLTTFRDYLGR